MFTESDNGAALLAGILGSVAREYGRPEFQAIEKIAAPGDATLNSLYDRDYLLLAQPVHIIAAGDRLHFQSDLFGAQPMEMFAESQTASFMTAQDMSIRFERGDEGAVTGFSLFRGAMSTLTQGASRKIRCTKAEFHQQSGRLRRSSTLVHHGLVRRNSNWSLATGRPAQA